MQASQHSDEKHFFTEEEVEDAVQIAILDFTDAILHGDLEHREWLRGAARDFINGNLVRKPNG